MQISDKGEAFVAVHEGRVHKAYKDSIGVTTIGVGFTMRSGIFAAYWRSQRGHDLRLGDTITDAECDMLLKRLLNEEYGVSIDARAKPTKQNEWDACDSVSYNAGPGSLNDGWAKALARGDVRTAASLLRGYKLTHGILKRRRADEARLLETGDYGKIDRAVIGTASAPSVSQTADEVRLYQQQLTKLGFFKGAVDGITGPATRSAVMAYQAQHPDLVADGIVGPATRASLLRDVTARANTATGSSLAAIVAVAGTGATAAGHPWLWAAGAVLVVVAVLAAALILKPRG